MKKKFTLFLSLLLIVATLLSITVASAEEPVTITIWTWDSTQHLVSDEYVKTHPNVNFEWVAVEGADYLTKIQQTLISGGELPDLIQADMAYRAALFNMDIFMNLDEAPFNFDPSVTLNYVPSLTSKDGHIIGIENNVNSAMLAYKKDLAREYLGTDDRSEIEAMMPDYDAMIAVAAQVAEKSEGKVRLFAGLQDISNMMLQQKKSEPILAEDGSLLLNERITDILNTVESFRNVNGAHHLAMNSTQWYACYGDSTAIFFPIATWGVHYNVEPNDPNGVDNWGLAIGPDGPFTMGGTCYCICNQSKHPEAVWDFIKWNLLEKEGATFMRDNNFLFMPNKELYEDAGYLGITRPNWGDLQVAQIMVEEVGSKILPGYISVYDSMIGDSLNMVVTLMDADASVTADAAYQVFIDDLSAKIPDVVIK